MRSSRSSFQSTFPLRGTTGAPGLPVDPFLFQSTFPLRGTTSNFARSAALSIFQSTFPLRGTTPCKLYVSSMFKYFNPRSPCGERRSRSATSLPSWNFNPRSPCGERPFQSRYSRHPVHFNPRSPCGERRTGFGEFDCFLGISIHVPLAGNDRETDLAAQAQSISIHVPLAGNDALRSQCR